MSIEVGPALRNARSYCWEERPILYALSMTGALGARLSSGTAVCLAAQCPFVDTPSAYLELVASCAICVGGAKEIRV